MQPASVSIDGQLLPSGGVHISAGDRAFQLGDGAFETLRARGGRVVELAEHVARLRHSLDVLEIPIGSDWERRLASDIRRLLESDGLAEPDADAAIRITVSRGTSMTRGVLPGPAIQPTVVIQAWPIESPSPEVGEGLRVIVSSIRRDPEHPLSGIKATSRADMVIARLEAQRSGADDAVFLTIDGYLAEATSANLFLVRDGQLATPDLRCAILPGTTRAWLLRWADQVGLRPVEELLTTRDLAESDEAFLTSSVAGVVPVTQFDDTTIGTGRPGPWTARARAAREACFALGPA